MTTAVQKVTDHGYASAVVSTIVPTHFSLGVSPDGPLAGFSWRCTFCDAPLPRFARLTRYGGPG